MPGVQVATPMARLVPNKLAAKRGKFRLNGKQAAKMRSFAACLRHRIK